MSNLYSKTIHVSLVFLNFIGHVSLAQENLVKNPGFEKMKWCAPRAINAGHRECNLCNFLPFKDESEELNEITSYDFSYKSWNVTTKGGYMILRYVLPCEWIPFSVLDKTNIFLELHDSRIFPELGLFGSRTINNRLLTIKEGRVAAEVFLKSDSSNFGPGLAGEALNQFYMGSLVSPLKQGCAYSYKMHMLREDFSGITSSVGVAFINDTTTFTTNQQIRSTLVPDIQNPVGRWLTDTANYTEIQSIYIAKGGEKNFVIGNFLSPATTPLIPVINPLGPEPNRELTYAKYYLDELSLVAIPPSSAQLDLGADKWICSPGMNIVLEAQNGFREYAWSTGDTGRVIAVTKPGKYGVRADYGCGNLYDSVTVRQFPKLKDQLGLIGPVSKCPSEKVELKALDGFSDYTWNNGNVGQLLTTVLEGTYTLSAISSTDCEVKDTVIVANILPPKSIELGSSISLCIGKSAILDPGFQKGVKYIWSTGSTSERLEVNNAGTYSLSVSNACYTISDTISIDTKDCSPIFIPNMFTPNGDGANDSFGVRTIDNRKVEVLILDRYGKELYKNEEYTDEWSAENLPDGIYFYQVSDQEYSKKYKGWVQVVR